MNQIQKIENPQNPIVFNLRNMQVMIDIDLAFFYEVALEDLHLAVNTYKNRFPQDFMIELTNEENKSIYEAHARFKSEAFCSLKTFAFTDKGMFMLSSILDTEKAVTLNINILSSVSSQRAAAAKQGVSADEVKQALLHLDNKINLAVNALNQKIESFDKEDDNTRKAVGFTYNKKDEKLKNSDSDLQGI